MPVRGWVLGLTRGPGPPQRLTERCPSPPPPPPPRTPLPWTRGRPRELVDRQHRPSSVGCPAGNPAPVSSTRRSAERQVSKHIGQQRAGELGELGDLGMQPHYHLTSMTRGSCMLTLELRALGLDCSRCSVATNPGSFRYAANFSTIKALSNTSNSWSFANIYKAKNWGPFIEKTGFTQTRKLKN